MNKQGNVIYDCIYYEVIDDTRSYNLFMLNYKYTDSNREFIFLKKIGIDIILLALWDIFLTLF